MDISVYISANAKLFRAQAKPLDQINRAVIEITLALDQRHL